MANKTAGDLFFVYILHCDNDSYYTGYTTNFERRFKLHQSGRASKYTRSFKPTGLMQCWQIAGSKADAMQLERFIKKLPKLAKKQLLERPQRYAEVFSPLISASHYLIKA